MEIKTNQGKHIGRLRWSYGEVEYSPICRKCSLFLTYTYLYTLVIPIHKIINPPSSLLADRQLITRQTGASRISIENESDCFSSVNFWLSFPVIISVFDLFYHVLCELIHARRCHFTLTSFPEST